MNFQDFEVTARARCKVLPLRQHLAHMGMGVMTEFGELLDAVKKVSIYGKQPDTVNFAEESADVAWYLMGYCEPLQIHPMMLQARYSSGFGQAAVELPKMMTEDGTALDYYKVANHLMIVMLAANAAVAQLLDSEATAPGNPSTTMVATIAECLGFAAGMLGVEIFAALDRNDAKLAKRHGTAFNANGALNRDAGAERAALEGGAA